MKKKTKDQKHGNPEAETETPKNDGERTESGEPLSEIPSRDEEVVRLRNENQQL